jgi:hypothetical protein
MNYRRNNDNSYRLSMAAAVADAAETTQTLAHRE